MHISPLQPVPNYLAHTTLAFSSTPYNIFPSCCKGKGQDKLTMQSHNTENKDQTQHQYHNRINLQSRALISIQPQHRTTASTSTCRTSRRRSSIGNLVLLVCCCAATDSGFGSSGRCWRGWTARGGAGRGGER
jgi:hypothetical protein